MGLAPPTPIHTQHTIGEQRMNRLHKQAIAATIALSLLTVGTFAWQSFSQTARNETITQGATAGGRLHDYFFVPELGSDTDIVQEVFVENYGNRPGNPETNAADIYVRVRLFEYLEYGTGAGVLPSEEAADTTDTLVRGDDIISLRGDKLNDKTPVIDDKSSWDIYLYGSEADEDETIRTYRDLAFGGSTTYMPTFNQRTDLKTPEVNGSLEGSTGDRHDDTSYDDYIQYDAGSSEEHIGYETGSVTYLDIRGDVQISAEQTYYPQSTLESTIITMEDWLLLSAAEKIAPMWVYDTDGWAYWAQPVEPNTATGLLLSGMDETKTVEGTDTYYAVHAQAQLASAGDWGDSDATDIDEKGMYADGITTNAESLLEFITQDQSQSGISLMSMSEMGAEYATDMVEIDGVSFQVLDYRTISEVDAEGYTTGTVDAKLLLAQENITELSLDQVTENQWSESHIRNTLLPQWLSSCPTLADIAVRVPVVTDGYYNSVDSYVSTEELDEVTYDKVFLLSQVEYLSTYGLGGISTPLKLGYNISYLRTWNNPQLPGMIDHNTGYITDIQIPEEVTVGIRPAIWVTY